MAVINLDTVVPDLDSALANFTHIKVYRSTTGITGSYSEITVPSTRPRLAENQSIYRYTDGNGDSDYFYKTSYFHEVSALESSLSEAVQGEGDPALDIVSVSDLQTNYLFGLDLTDDSGEEYPDTLYEWFIKSAVSWMEHLLDIPIRPRSITDERHPFIKQDYVQYIWLKVNHFPLIEASEVRLVLPGEVTVQTFDSDWIHANRNSGVVQLVPGSNIANTVLIGAAGAWMPFIYGGHDFIPDAFRIDYTAGFTSGEVPDIFKDAIAKVASFGPLNIAGDLLGGAGIASQAISIDGLSQSFNTTSSATNAGYGARLLQYQKELKQVLPTLRNYYKGVQLVVI
jgi:hypothetical protein